MMDSSMSVSHVQAEENKISIHSLDDRTTHLIIISNVIWTNF